MQISRSDFIPALLLLLAMFLILVDPDPVPEQVTAHSPQVTQLSMKK